MIPITPAPEPADFDEKVRMPGLRSVAEKVGKAPMPPRTSGKRFRQVRHKVMGSDGKPMRDENGNVRTAAVTREEDLLGSDYHPYWRKALPELKLAYDNICAFACIRIHRVTGAASVDHMLPKSSHWREAYEWLNFRLCCALINGRKGDVEGIADPFEIEAGWFQLNFISYEVTVSTALRDELRDKLAFTIEALRLNDPVLCETRAEHHGYYLNEDVTFAQVKREAPFLAYELERQGRLRSILVR